MIYHIPASKVRKSHFFMTVLAYQSKYIVSIEAVPVLFSSIIYCILFLVEVHSIIENLIDAGAEDLKPLLLRFRRERDKMVGSAGDILSDVTGGESGPGPQPRKESGDDGRPPI